MTTTERRAAALESPYKGLLPYSEADSDRFFGREAECALIISNLQARRLTLLYGESGVGKSSLLRAGVARDLRDQARRRQAERGRARFVPVVFDAWRDDPVAALMAAVADQAAEFLPDGADSTAQPERLDEALELWSRRLDAKLLLVLDQFEEYFLYHPTDDAEGTLVEELPRALMRSDVRANFLIAMREDALAKLDGFRSRIPDLMGNRLRIRHLDRQHARDAIEKPIDYHNRTHRTSFSIEPALVEAVLDQVEAGKVQLDGAGLGEAARGNGQAEARIEAPYLQLVLERLWDAEMAAKSTTLRLETLAELKGSETIVRTHLDEVMGGLASERQDAAAAVFRYLVTRGGTKVAYSAGDLAELVGRSETDVQKVLRELDDVRILRTVDGADRAVDRYEIFHDVLAAAVLDWRQRHDEAGRLARERSEKEDAERRARLARQAELRQQRRARIFRALMLVSAALFLLAAGAAVVAVLERNEANREKKEQASAAVGRRALELLDTRPDVSMLAALEAYRLRETFEARDAVLSGLHRNASLPRALVGHFRSANAVAFSPDADLLASVGSDATLRLWDVRSARALGTRVIDPDVVPLEVAFADGQTLVTGGDDGTLRLWDVSDPRKPVVRGGAVQADVPGGASNADVDINGLAISPERRILAVALEDGRLRLWRIGEKLELIPREGRVGAGAWSLAFSPDGRKLASAASESEEAGTVSLWDVSRLTGKAPLVRSTVEQPGVDSVAFRAGGTMLAAGGDDGRVILWKVAGRRLHDAKALSGHLAAVWGLAFSGDGSVLASAGDDNTVLLWDAERRLPFGGPRSHAGDVNAVAVSSDGEFVASAGDDRLVKLWRVGGPSLATTLGTAPEVNWGVAVGAESTLAVAGDSVRHWNLADVRPDGLAAADSRRRPFPGQTVEDVTDGKWGASFSGDLLAVTGSNVALGRFPEPGKLEWSLKVDNAWSVDFAPGDKTLAVGTREGELTLWNVANPAEPDSLREKPIRAHRGFIFDVVFSPDGTRLATAGQDGTVKLWDVTDRARATQLGKPLVGHGGHAVSSLAFAPDGRTLASGGRDQRLALWDLRDLENPRRINLPFQEQSNTILGLAFSADGELLAAGDADDDVVIWDVARRESLGGDLAAHTLGEPAEAPKDSAEDPSVEAVAFDERGYLISAGRHVPVVVWSAELWSDDYETLRKNVCAIVRRPLNEAEWRHFFGGTPFEDEKPQACVGSGN